MGLFPLSGDDTAMTTADPLKRAEINLLKTVMGEASRTYGGTVSTFPGRLELTDLAAAKTICTKLRCGATPSNLETLFSGAGQWASTITKAMAAANNTGKMQDTWGPAPAGTAIANSAKFPTLLVAGGITAAALIWFIAIRK